MILCRFAWGILVALLVVGIACIFIPKYKRLREYQRTRAELEEQNTRLEQSIRQLVTNQERFESESAFVERTARESGRVKPSEFVFRYTNAESQATATVP
ncbi:septum formation initiator family protein [Verrucomicrobiota bacterium]